MARPVYDAVTAVLLHDGELLFVKRQHELPAFPGYHAFPGGKVDDTDLDDPLEHALFSDHEPRLMRALIRELTEEIGFDLASAACQGSVASIHYLDEVTTPAWVPYRFRTRFYRIDLHDRPDIELDTRECRAAEWRSIPDWKDHYDAGRLLLAPPTRLVLDALHEDPARTSLPPFPEKHFEASDAVPCLEPIAGLRILLVRSNTLPPATHTNVFCIGEPGDPRVLIDPSPANGEELQRLFQVTDDLGIDLVFLTHHHPDHHQFSTDVARRYGIPMGMSADTQRRIRARAGDAHFASIEVRTFSEGDVLTRWQGEPVRTLSVPGHDEGQLAPMPDSRTWCIVGDLIQGVGTVVIGGEEGNMRKYFASLQRIIDLDPDVIIPSHGMAMGSTHYLQAALHHRKKRERQVLAGHQSGRSEQDMLQEIYADLDPRMQPLALMNIRKHLEKLQEEGQLG